MLDPWSTSQVNDYNKVMKEFGLEHFDPSVLPDVEKQPRLFKKKIVFGHRGFDYVLRRINRGEPFAILSGLMPTSKRVVEGMAFFRKKS